MMLSATLAWRYLIGRGARSLLTTLAVALGVMLTFGLNGITPALEAAFTRSLLSSAGQIDLTVTDSYNQSFPATVADRVAAVPGVAAVSPEAQRTAPLPPSADPGPDDVTQLTVIGSGARAGDAIGVRVRPAAARASASASGSDGTSVASRSRPASPAPREPVAGRCARSAVARVSPRSSRSR